MKLESLTQTQRRKLHTFGVTEPAKLQKLLSDPGIRTSLLEELGLTEETVLPIELELKQLEHASPIPKPQVGGTLIPDDW